MSQHELALAAAKLIEETGYYVFPVRANKVPCWRCLAAGRMLPVRWYRAE